VTINLHFYFSIEDLTKVKEENEVLREDLSRVNEENEDLQEEVSDLYEFGAYRNVEREMENEIWAEDSRKLWEAQKKNIDHVRTIVKAKERLREAHTAIVQKNEQINSLEEGICSLLEFNKNLVMDEGQAEGVYNEAKKVLKQCNIVLHDEDITETSLPDVEMVDDK
jgi:chromosome segregation ATPase